MTKISLPEIVRRVDQLPELPQVAMRLNRMLEDPNADAQKLAEVIRLDAGFTSQVLRLCNSAAYGFSRKISTVKEAVAILGFNTLRSMVYTIISKLALDRPVPGYSLKEGALWVNALTCAVYAKHIAKRERLVDPELAYTGALLRDIGKIVLGEFVGPNYAEIERIAMENQIDFVEAEEKVLGVSHTMVGTKVAEKWNLPTQLAQVIRYHHKPLSLPPTLDDTSRRLIVAVHLADVFTMMVGQGNGSDGMMYSLDINALQQVGIQVDEVYLETLMGELVELNKVVADLVNSFVAQEV